MTKKDLIEFRRAIKAVRAVHAASPEKARQFLAKQGVLDKRGQLTKKYAPAKARSLTRAKSAV
ncbi:hypothetical protein [Blastochloris sulfoviridis]|uniref:Uncharacterized protein n=1 Tax=Blastochloris sulfoviridis TaxID=50712 RepID=A0A5M6HQT6_9HYPH|nr:hypothetical protein [Blastochloris sulfoviridis]KAA5598234.1 hypothetical protein F1193_13360 [Blastochloris sulfoviridis]